VNQFQDKITILEVEIMRAFYEGKYLEFGICNDQWFLLPTITYNPMKYRFAETRPIYIMFLTFYILLGKERG